MPAFQSLVVTDRQGTPVNTTLVPSQRDVAKGTYTVALPDATGSYLSEKRFTISTRRTADRIKVSVKYRAPVVTNETINGVARPALLRESFVTALFDFHKDSLESERNNVVGEWVSAFATTKALTHDSIVKAQDVWG